MPKARIDESFEMFYDVDDFTDPWRTPETVLMQHGNNKNGKFWYAWIPLLSGQYRLIRPDSRGQGRSPMPEGHKYTWKGFADDMNALVESLGLEKVHLIGETLGGALCVLFAYYYPDKVKSLTISNGPLRWTDARSIEMLGRSRRDYEQIGAEAYAKRTMYRRLGNDADPAEVEWQVKEISKTPTHTGLAMLDLMLSGEELTDYYRNVSAPTLILASQETYEDWPTHAKEVFPLIPNARVGVLPGTIGFIAHSEPAKCAAIWREFVAGLG